VLEFALRMPSPALQPHVRDLCGYRERTRAPLRRREFPGARVVVILEFGPPIRVYESGTERNPARHPGGFVAGLDERFTLTEHDGFQRGLQLNLTPIGARLFFDRPMSELVGRTIPFADLMPRPQRDLAERLAALPDWNARFAFVEGLVAQRIANARVRTDPVAWAFSRIEASRGAVPIRAIARELGYSPKHLIALFRDQIGVPPKLVSRIVRFEHLLRHVRASGAGSWSQLALDFGYYDQAHLARDVQHFTGMTPGVARALLVEPDPAAASL
jgi:AraC-like DNA-binding protein